MINSISGNATSKLVVNLIDNYRCMPKFYLLPVSAIAPENTKECVLPKYAYDTAMTNKLFYKEFVEALPYHNLKRATEISAIMLVELIDNGSLSDENLVALADDTERILAERNRYAEAMALLSNFRETYADMMNEECFVCYDVKEFDRIKNFGLCSIHFKRWMPEEIFEEMTSNEYATIDEETGDEDLCKTFTGTILQVLDKVREKEMPVELFFRINDRFESAAL